MSDFIDEKGRIGKIIDITLSVRDHEMFFFNYLGEDNDYFYFEIFASVNQPHIKINHRNNITYIFKIRKDYVSYASENLQINKKYRIFQENDAIIILDDFDVQLNEFLLNYLRQMGDYIIDLLFYMVYKNIDELKCYIDIENRNIKLNDSVNNFWVNVYFLKDLLKPQLENYKNNNETEELKKIINTIQKTRFPIFILKPI